MKYMHRIVIGDWSNDGHNQSNFFNFECSHDEKAVKKAYLVATKKCKVSLHEEKILKGIKSICCNYQDHFINGPELKALEKLGVDFSFAQNEFEEDDGEFVLGCCAEDIANLFFEMVKTQITGFEYKMVKEQKTINGFWSRDFNFNFGYGCFN